jgi:GNAT superfamily N-acetyltransferase
MTIVIEEARSEAEIDQVRGLFRAYAASLPFDLGFQNFAAELESLPGPYAAPDGCLLLARQAAEPVGCVGVKRLATGIAEIKRLYVVQSFRGTGLGRRLLEAAIECARQIGFRSVRLDSHSEHMHAAIALYRKLGFAEIPPYGPDLDGRLMFFEKRLWN